MDINETTITLTFGTGSLDTAGAGPAEGKVGPDVGLECLQTVAAQYPDQASLLTIDLVQYGGEVNGHILILRDMFQEESYHPDTIFNLFYHQLSWDSRVYDRYKRMCNNVSRLKTNARQEGIDAPFSALQPIRLRAPDDTTRDLFTEPGREVIELKVESLEVDPVEYMTRTHYNASRIPCLDALMTRISTWMPGYPFYCECNAYPPGGHIGYHGDSERSFVIGGRYGATMPIQWQVFCKSKPLGDPIRLDLPHGCIYLMDTVAAGTYIKKSVPYIKHCAGHPPGVELAPPHPMSPPPGPEIKYQEVEMISEGWYDPRPVLKDQLARLKIKAPPKPKVVTEDYIINSASPYFLCLTDLVSSRKVGIKNFWLEGGNYMIASEVHREVTIMCNKRRKVRFEDITFTATNEWHRFSIPEGGGARIHLSPAGKKPRHQIVVNREA